MMQAYDIEMLKRSFDRHDPDDHGWVFGLPPGITPEQWPLDPNNGFPLMHGFTIMLPDDYRCHGPDIVALSFFATSPDLHTGEPLVFDDIRQTFAEDARQPDDPILARFWRAARSGHPHLHRLSDILGCAYAAILLTRDELYAPVCPAPAPIDPQREPRPHWLKLGTAAVYHEGNLSTRGTVPDADHPVFQAFGAFPDGSLAFHRALRCKPRAHDPNAGLAPQERWVAEKSGYQPEWVEVDGKPVRRDYPWIEGLARNHLGGTMQPTQNIPDGFSPFYIEFDEDFGGYNFGLGGNAQLDFKNMLFDWACG